LALLVRTWNVFHGNATPPERRGFLKEMVRLASADHPDVLCLQEVPVWALRRLAEWSGMRSFGAVAARPALVHAELGGAVTGLHQGRLRSAFSGQANAILVGATLNPLAEDSIVLNPRRFRRTQAESMGLNARERLAWAKERRVCQAVRVSTGEGPVVVANLHISSHTEPRIRDAELLRAAVFADAFAEPGDILVLAGDFNIVRERSETLEQLPSPDWGFSPAIAGLDQILVRGAKAATPEQAPQERRRLDGRLLSDHAPVEVRIG
jgi:endonuclease/exonuclease/phosphatase family metal-dependent hydrolase